MMLISKNTISLQRPNFTHSLINVLFSLDNTRNKSLWLKTLQATCQIVGLCVNSLQDEPTPENHKEMVVLIGDLAAMSRGESPKWFIEVQDPYIIYSSIGELLDNKYIVSGKDEWKQPIGEVMPGLRKILRRVFENNHPSTPGNTNSKTWELTSEEKIIILLKLGCKYTRIFHSGFEILEEIVKLLTEKSNLHWKMLGY